MPQPEWLAAGLRLALYLDLALVFGLPLFCLYALHRDERAGHIARRCRVLALGGAMAGIALSLVALVEMARSMTGASDYAALQGHVLAMIVTGTDFGVAWCVRMAALLLFVLAGLHAPRLRAPFAVLAAYGGVALATLAWGGHGAMHDGAVRYLHLASDVVHLLAAGAWIGALAALMLLAWPGSTPHGGDLALLGRTANGFARIGTRIVALLVITGALNYWLIVGPAMPAITGLAPMSYGGLLAAKVALFAAMLGLAAANRFALAPRLAAAARTGESGAALRAVQALRRSLLLEAGAAALVLALVAVLGMLSPA